jgi:hypothetical protein
MPIRILLTFLTLVSVALGQSAARPGTIEGAILSLVKGAPLPDANVVLTPVDHGNALSMTTAQDGRFAFRNVEAGKYRLSATRRGFVEDGRETAITLQSGQELKDLVIQLAPFAAVAGRVFDDFGEPLVGAAVQILQPVYLNHRRSLVPVSFTSTNDLGEFRAHSLVAGRYLVKAEFRESNRTSGYAPVFYPNATTASSAMFVALVPGETQQGINFQLRRTQTFTIRGRVAGAAATGVRTVWLQATANGEWIPDGREVVPVRDGAFEIFSVRPGHYVVTIEEFGPTGGAKAAARADVDVADRDIDNLELTPRIMPELTGRVVLEYPAKRDPVSFSSRKGSPVVVRLVPREDPDPTNLPRGPVGESGVFKATGGAARVYDVEMLNLAPDLFLKAIHVGTTDVTGKGIDRTQGTVDEVTLVLSDAGGSIEGTVNGDSAPVVSAVVIAVSQTGLDMNRKEAVSDEHGHFVLKGIAPGEYRIFAFEGSGPGAPEDPDVLKQLEGFSIRVSVEERSCKLVSLRAIPARAIQD